MFVDFLKYNPSRSPLLGYASRPWEVETARAMPRMFTWSFGKELRSILKAFSLRSNKISLKPAGARNFRVLGYSFFSPVSNCRWRQSSELPLVDVEPSGPSTSPRIDVVYTDHSSVWSLALH